MFGKSKKKDESTKDWSERAKEALEFADRAIVQNPVPQNRRDAIELRGD
jgi:hypothetical protein